MKLLFKEVVNCNQSIYQLVILGKVVGGGLYASYDQ